MAKKISHEELEQRVKELEQELLDRKRLENALHESEQKYSALFKQSANSMLLFDLETVKVVEFNESACRNLGYTREEFEKINVPDFEVVESPEEIKLHIAKLIETGSDTFETKHRTKSGDIRNVAVNSKVITLGGKPYSQVIFTDVTDLKRTEAALKESEARYRALFESVPIGIGLAAKDGRLLACNDQVVQMTGYSREELEQFNCRDFYFNPEDREKFLERFQTAGFVRNFEMQMKRKDGTGFDASLNARPITLGGKDIILTAVQDISYRKRAEDRLRLLSSVIEQSSEGIAITDLKGNLVFLNNAFAAMHGYVPEDLVGKHLSIFHTPEQIPYVEATNRQLRETGEFHGEVWHARRDGTLFPGQMHNLLVRDDAGNPIAMVGALRDISEQRETERKLIESEERLNAFFSEAPAGLVIFDENFRYVKINETLARISGLPVQEHIGKTVYEVLQDISDNLSPVLQRVLETDATVANEELTGEISGKNGTRRHWVYSAFPVSWGEQRGVGNIVVEVTKQKQAEDALRRTNAELEEKTRALEAASRYKSEFLANVSHELRTPLNSILLLSRHLAENRDGGLTQDHMESAQAIYSSGSDLLALINQVLDLSKIEAGKTELSVEDVGLEDFARGIKKSFQPIAAEKGLTLEVKLAAGSPGTIRTDRQRLEQIVKNFLSNAFKFTSRGDITFSIGRPGDQLIDGTDLSESGLDSAKTVSISVIDTGVGIPKDRQKLIFDAFRQADGSTSRKYGGTGLGLSISTQLAKLLGGEIRLKSEEGKGSTFTLYLPETMEEAKPETRNLGLEASNEDPEVSSKPKAQSSREGQPATRKEPIPANKKILVVDDDMRNLFSLKRILEYKGMEVLVGKNGKEALERLNDNPDIDLVLMDIMMPGMDGYEAMREIRKQKRFKDLPVIAVTAKAMKEDRTKCIEAGATDYLTKPVDLEKLFSLLVGF